MATEIILRQAKPARKQSEQAQIQPEKLIQES
jgi:hypothetical protein